MRDEMNTDNTSVPRPPTQRNTTVNASTQKNEYSKSKHLTEKTQVMSDLPFVRVEVRLHTHVVGYLVVVASS